MAKSDITLGDNKSATIKSIIPPGSPCFAAFLPDEENDIKMKIVPIVCWSLLSFDNSGPDEVVGQIISGDTIVETTYVDADEGFGEFVGYFYSEESARIKILSIIADADEEDEGYDDGEGEIVCINPEVDPDDDEEDEYDEGDEDDEEDEG